MRYALILLLLAGSALACYGQGRDTAFAVHKLFTQKRRGAETSMAGGAGLVSSAATLNGAVSGALVGAAPVLLGLRQAQHYGAEREATILSRYAEGWPLPADIRKQLRRKYFHRTPKDLPAGK